MYMAPFFVSKNNPFWIVLLCRSILPVFLGSLHIYGCVKYFAYKMNYINLDTRVLDYDRDVMGELTDENINSLD